MPHDDQGPGQHGPSASQSFNLFVLVVSGHAACLWPFTRINLGGEALFPEGLVAMLVMVFYAGFGECPEILAFVVLWFFAVAFHRIRSLIYRSRMRQIHARWDGDPWLAECLWPFGRPGDFLAKMVIEPILAVMIGGLVYFAVSPSLGRFFMAAAVSMMFLNGVRRIIQNARLRAWRDKDFEMRAMAARIRSGR